MNNVLFQIYKQIYKLYAWKKGNLFIQIWEFWIWVKFFGFKLYLKKKFKYINNSLSLLLNVAQIHFLSQNYIFIIHFIYKYIIYTF